MKGIIISVFFLLAISSVSTAQSTLLLNKIWKVEKYIAIQGTDTITYYHKDSTNNWLNYAQIEMNFINNSQFTSKNIVGTTINGTWNLGATNDSLGLNNQKFAIHQLTTNSFVTKGSATQILDTLGNTGIATLYLSFYNVNAVLPLSLTQFKGENTPSGNNLTWTTSTESNVKHFEIERSSDGQTWRNIGIVKAVGNSTVTRRYNFLDKTASSKAYYRLRSMDNDGRTELSNVIYLSNSKEYEIDVFPVPSSDNVTIRYNASENSEAEVNIFDIAGKLCFGQKIELQKGLVDYPLNISDLPRGVYMLQFNNNGKTLVNKIIKD